MLCVNGGVLCKPVDLCTDFHNCKDVADYITDTQRGWYHKDDCNEDLVDAEKYSVQLHWLDLVSYQLVDNCRGSRFMADLVPASSRAWLSIRLKS